MTKVYRHPYNRSKQPSPFERPPKPRWLARSFAEHVALGKNRRSYQYWTRMFYATPPWLTDEHVRQMKFRKETCPDNCELDHEVPLAHPIVCGLNVPWNLAVRPKTENQQKSNAWWPDMPMQPVDMFCAHRHTTFELDPGHPQRRKKNRPARRAIVRTGEQGSLTLSRGSALGAQSVECVPSPKLRR